VTDGGTYQVRVSNANGCVALTNEVTLTKNITPPTVQIAGNTTLNCNNGQTTLTASGASSYTWTATPALPGGKSEQNPLTVNVAGTYSVTGTAPNGCTNTTSVNVVADPSAISPGLTPQSGVLTCSVTSFVLTASGGSSYTLLNTNTTNTTGQFTVSTPDTFTVRVGNAANCTAIATTTLTRFTTAPTMTTTGNSVLTPASPNSTIGVTANLTGGSISGYSWSGPGVPANTVTSSIPVSQTGIYTVTVQGNNGCTSTTTITVTGDLTPVTASITPSATAICPGQTVNLVASGGVAYRWSNGPTIASNPVTPLSTTTLSVTVTGSNGATALATATITVNTTPNLGITSGGAISCQSAATLTASGAATYAWNNGTQGASLTVNSAGSYTVVRPRPGPP
jgi:large repetitive protein